MNAPAEDQATATAPGTLYVVSAPSGAGKTSLVRALAARDPRVRLSVSHTTRPRRSNESDGVHYHFVTRGRFEAMIAEGRFLEHARVFDHLYGTAREEVFAVLQQGLDVILEIDWQGARQVRERMPRSIGIFILPPSLEALERRLRERAQDRPEVITRRLGEARAEIAHHGEFDYLIVNEVFDEALADLQATLRAGRVRREVQLQRHAARIARLLAPAQDA